MGAAGPGPSTQRRPPATAPNVTAEQHDAAVRLVLRSASRNGWTVDDARRICDVLGLDVDATVRRDHGPGVTLRSRLQRDGVDSDGSWAHPHRAYNGGRPPGASLSGSTPTKAPATPRRRVPN